MREKKGKVISEEHGHGENNGEEKRGANQGEKIFKNVSSPHQLLSLVKSSLKDFYT